MFSTRKIKSYILKGGVGVLYCHEKDGVIENYTLTLSVSPFVHEIFKVKTDRTAKKKAKEFLVKNGLMK